MQSCSSAHSVLILLLMIFITGSESAVPIVKVEYGGTAVLPCTDKCSGVVSWTRTDKSSDILAECDQTSCRSVKEGYQIIHDQYLQGNLSLIITEADFNKRGRYTCDCDDIDKCDVELQIYTPIIQVQKKNGESLVMELDLSYPVQVIYISTGAPAGFSDQIYTLIGGSLQCKPEYKHRTLLSSSALELRDMKDSDSGVYIIRTIKNKEGLYIYTLNVISEGHSLRAWKEVLICLLVVLVVGLLMVVVWGWKKVKSLKPVKKNIHIVNVNIEIQDQKNGEETAEQQRDVQDQEWKKKFMELEQKLNQLQEQIQEIFNNNKKHLQMHKELEETGQKPELLKEQEQEIENWEPRRGELDPVTLIQSYVETWIVMKQFLKRVTSAEADPLLTERTQKED